MGLTFKFNTRGFRAKREKWARMVGAEQLTAVKRYGAEAVKQMVRYTPPAGGKVGVARGLANLKARIKEDLMGDGGKVYSDRDIVWRRNKQGQLFARFKAEDGSMRGHPSPFRMFTGAVSSQKLAALGVGGRHKVEFAEHPGRFINSRSQYVYRRRGSSRAIRLTWHGTRHVARLGAVAVEVKRRQRKVGKLMAGWKELARMTGARLHKDLRAASGRGSAVLRRDAQHKATITAHNREPYPGLQAIVDRQVKRLRPRLRRMANGEVKRIKRKLKKA